MCFYLWGVGGALVSKKRVLLPSKGTLFCSYMYPQISNSPSFSAYTETFVLFILRGWLVIFLKYFLVTSMSSVCSADIPGAPDFSRIRSISLRSISSSSFLTPEKCSLLPAITFSMLAIRVSDRSSGPPTNTILSSLIASMIGFCTCASVSADFFLQRAEVCCDLD